MGSQEQAKLQKRLDAAEAAYERIMLGESVKVLVDQSGERIEFNTANVGRLAAYIHDLKRQLGLLGRSSMGPLRFVH